MKKALLLLSLLATLLGNKTQAQSKDEAAVATAVEALRKAMVDPTKETLSKLTAEELSYGHSSGKIQDKAQFIEALTSNASDFVSIELTEQTIKLAGNVALVRHTLSANTNDGGKPGTVKLHILTVWQKQRGQWKLLARQAVKLP
jgi:ketosteroid isomerase-like protein